MPLEVISQEAGFNTVNYFIKTFKEWEGITPGKYRKEQVF